jgi:hypothetical protein
VSVSIKISGLAIGLGRCGGRLFLGRILSLRTPIGRDHQQEGDQKLFWFHRILSVANKQTDLDRPLRSVGRGLSSLLVGRSRSDGLKGLLDGYGTYTLKWEVDELEKAAALTLSSYKIS